ncbi:MAG: cytochrome c [Rhodobacteraceae bacterium]|nr:cytochrome c [Paracoccaceae bacterium]
MSGIAIAESAGHAEYMGSCAVCHGDGALGDGPLSKYMTLEVPELTTLAKANGGEFPMLRVIQVIDGRGGLRGHGDARPDSGGNMPVWGDRFAAQETEMAGVYGAELLVRGRILALAQYLESIQN